MSKKQKYQIEFKDLNNGHMTVTKGTDNVQLNFDEAKMLLTWLNYFVSSNDELPF